MANINFGRIQKALPNLSNQRLLELHHTVAQELAARNVVIEESSYQAGYIEGTQKGMAQAASLIDEYLLPAEEEVHSLEKIASYMAGVINAGLGDIPRAILTDTVKEFGAQIANIITAYSHAQGKGRLTISTPDLSLANNIFECAQAYISNSGDDGAALRSIFAQNTKAFRTHLVMREMFRPGRKRDDNLTRLDFDALALVENGKTIREAVEYLAMLPSYESEINEWTDPEETLKKRLQRIRGQNVLSHQL